MTSVSSTLLCGATVDRPLRLLLIAPSDMAMSPALEQALALAPTLNGALHMISFVHSKAVDGVGRTDHEGRNQARESLLSTHRLWLESVASGLRDKGIEVSCEAIWSRPTARALVAGILLNPADLIIKDFNEDSTAVQWMLGTRDSELLRASPASLLFVSQAPDHRSLTFLAVIDFDPADPEGAVRCDELVETARRLAEARGAALHLLSVYDPSESGALLFDEVFDTAVLQGFAKRQAAFDHYAHAHGIEQGHRHFSVGHSSHAITDYINHNDCDLLLVATHRNGPSDEVAGSQAQGLIRHPACSVLVLKPTHGLLHGRPSLAASA